MFVLAFYILAPIPLLIAQRVVGSDSIGAASSALQELCLFITTGIVTSAYGLPLVLVHTNVVSIMCSLIFFRSAYFNVPYYPY